MRKWLWIGAVVLAILLSIGGFLFYQVRHLEVDRVTQDIHVITGLGGNVAVLDTGAGTVVVDTMSLVLQGKQILARAEELTGKPVETVINTHYHLDHTHGNPAFPRGTKVVSTARTLEHLQNLDAGYWSGDAAHLLPNETFETEHEITLGQKTLRLYHLGRGHTDGDLVVLFVEDRVLHMGDLFFNHQYPNIDLEAGGTVVEWDETLDRAFELEFDHIIPGHGAPTDRSDMRQFQRFLRQLAEVGARAASQGKSLEETLKEAELTEDSGYDTMEIPFVVSLNREFVIRRAWEEATGAVQVE